ncbi:hypothetical protein WMZ97_01950 [Lentibacillus sp. N15]
MKKVLIALFIALIIGFSIVGVTQYTTKSSDVIEQPNNAVNIES